MSEPVLDTMVLQALGCGHPSGLTILFEALDVTTARIPAEVYNRDEHVLPIEAPDRGLSEFARGLRFAQRQVAEKPRAQAQRYQAWLEHIQQLNSLIASGSIIISTLDVDAVRQRENLIAEYGIGSGEAACLALALRRGSPTIFVSSDEIACRVADRLTLPRLTLEDVLERWISTSRPTIVHFDERIAGMTLARFQLQATTRNRLRRQLSDQHERR